MLIREMLQDIGLLDIYAEFDAGGLEADFQGWEAYDHPLLPVPGEYNLPGTDTIFPLPMTSSAAARLLAEYDIKVDLIYIDAGHEEYEVYGDLAGFWPLVRHGCILWRDDYSPCWPGVVSAAIRFAYDNDLLLETSGGKFCFTK